MQILNKEEAAQLSLKKIGGSRTSENLEFYLAVRSLEVGQHILIKKDEWVSKTTPSGLLSTVTGKKYGAGRKFHIFGLTDGTGWLVAINPGKK